MLTKVPRQDLSNDLGDRILGFIAERNLLPGDRLPALRELAAMFAVATPTVREALRRLQALGMVDMRHGSGVYVRRTQQRLMLSNPHLSRSGIDRADMILDLLDARQLIEPALAELAAVHASDEELNDLAGLLDLAGGRLARSDDALNESNMAFHVRIALLSGNSVLAEIMDSLIELRLSDQLMIQEIFDARERDHLEHVHILEALRSRDADLARERMANHLEMVRTVVAERLRVDGLLS